MPIGYRFPVLLGLAVSTYPMFGGQIVFRIPHSRATDAIGVNAGGVIAGEFQHKRTAIGMVRAADGRINTFRIGGVKRLQISVAGINDAGTIAGSYTEPGVATRGFLRSANGAVTIFDVPAGSHATSTYGVNAGGSVTGVSVDANSASHGFLRAPDGTITMFDAPGAGTEYNEGTVPQAINAGGAISGSVTDAQYLAHGFVRSSDGGMIVFDAPNAGHATVPTTMNDAGAIAGYYEDANGVFHGFLRDPDGTITSFDPHDASAAAGQGTFPRALNDAGEVVGYYNRDHVRGTRAFVRLADGSFRSMHRGPADCQAFGVNRTGLVVGSCRDAKGVTSGFLWMP